MSQPGQRRSRREEHAPDPARPAHGRGLRHFRVRWDGRLIDGIEAISGLEFTTEVVPHRAGAQTNMPHLAPGKTANQPLVLTRPRTTDPAFEAWARLVWDRGASPGAEVALRDFRKDVAIELLDDAGRVQVAFRLYRCWPSHYAALSAMRDGDGAAETLTLQFEGWERDETVGRSHPGRRKAPD